MLMADTENPSCLLLPPFNRSLKSLHSRYSFLLPLLCPPFHLSWKLLCFCYSCLHPLCSPLLLRLNSQNPNLLVHCLNYNFLLRCYCLLPVDLQAFCPAYLYFAVLKCTSINVVVGSACSGTPWLRYITYYRCETFWWWGHPTINCLSAVCKAMWNDIPIPGLLLLKNSSYFRKDKLTNWRQKDR